MNRADILRFIAANSPCSARQIENALTNWPAGTVREELAHLHKTEQVCVKYTAHPGTPRTVRFYGLTDPPSATLVQQALAARCPLARAIHAIVSTEIKNG